MESNAGSPRRCERCGKDFVPRTPAQRYDGSKCRFGAANRRKSMQRRVEATDQVCSVPDCTYRSPRGRFYRHTIAARSVVFCGWHHAERYRRKSSNGEIPLVTGGYHYGYFHVSIYGLTEKRLYDEQIFDDGGIAQLIDHLSGEVDSDGSRIPHPFVSRRFEMTVYASRSV